MIELPMSGFAGRGELKNQIVQLLVKQTDKPLAINVYGDKGVGKSTLVAAAIEGFKKKAFMVDIDFYKKYLRFPENALYELRNEVEAAYADNFALFDLLYIMRVERISGALKIPPSDFFRNNSGVMQKVFDKYPSDKFFSRNFYKMVEDGLLYDWFEEKARKAVMRMFQAQNQFNWESLISAFATGMKEYKKKTGHDMIIIVENADDIFEVDDCGNSWATSLMDKSGCGKFIFISKEQLSPQKTGRRELSIPLGNFSPEDGNAYFDSIGICSEPVVETVYDNTQGNPALMSYCIETSDMYAEREGRDPTVDIYEADPENIVQLHLSNVREGVSRFAKVLSVVRVFNGELFEAFRSEFVADSDKRTLPIKVFTDMRFVDRVGNGFFAVQESYRQEAVKTLDPDTLENVHYQAYQFHTNKLKSDKDYLDFPFHLYEALYHAKATLDVDGFIMWFRGVEKDFLSAEFFNMWLGIYEIVRAHVAGILGETHADTVAINDTLAYLYLKAGRFLDSEETMKQSLAFAEEQYGKGTPETVPFMNKLASIYLQTGDYKAAQAILLSGLEIREDKLGKEHKDVADSLLRLSNFFNQIGKKAEALGYAERASAIVNKSGNIDDEQRMEAEENMAAMYAKSKNMAKAVQLYKKISMEKREKYGEYAKETIKGIGEYAESVLKNGQPGKAVMLYEEVLEKTQKAYGSNSKALASATNDLAFAYQKNKDYDKAEVMHKKALEIKDMLYGDNHPSTATSYSNMAQLKYLTGNLTDAEEGYKKAAKVYETVLGKVHPKTALGFNNLGFLTSRMGHFEEAEKYYMDALASKKALGEENTVSFASTLNNLGELMYRMGRKDEAVDYLKQALEIYQDVLGDEHNTTKVVAKNLAAISK